MGYGLAGCHIPVNVAHIVVVLVLAQVGQIHASAPQQGAVVALQQAVQATQHGPFQPAQQVLCRHHRRRCGGRLSLGLDWFKKRPHGVRAKAGGLSVSLPTQPAQCLPAWSLPGLAHAPEGEPAA